MSILHSYFTLAYFLSWCLLRSSPPGANSEGHVLAHREVEAIVIYGRRIGIICADPDHLIFLPSGNTALTRRARKHSFLSAAIIEPEEVHKILSHLVKIGCLPPAFDPASLN